MWLKGRRGEGREERLIWEINLPSDFVKWVKSGWAIAWDGRSVEGRRLGFVLMVAAISQRVVTMRAQDYTLARLTAGNGDINTIDQSIKQ